MKTTRRIHLEPFPFPDSGALAPFTDGLVRLYRGARDFAGEVYATVAGVIEVPLRQARYDGELERLDTHMLRDIGQDRDERR